MLNIYDLRSELENPSENLCVTPGTRAQIVGAQNGSFPAFGHHVPNEMGGVWMHPIKLLDGFWLGLEIGEQPFAWLKEAKVFRNFGFYNEQEYSLSPLKIVRRQFVPQETPGVIIQYDIINESEETVSLNGELVARSDLSPVWFSEEAGIVAGEDEGRIEGQSEEGRIEKQSEEGRIAKQSDKGRIEKQSDEGQIRKKSVVIKDSKHPWFVNMQLEGVTSEITIGDEIEGYEKTYGQGTGASWKFSFSLAAEQSLALIFRIVGSMTSAMETVEIMNQMEDVKALFQEKEAHYQEIVAVAALDIPDKELMEQYTWVKCHMEWLTTRVPGIGAGLTAGNPEYVWWFGCDSAYALAGCVPAGFHRLAEETLDTVEKFSAKVNGNGRIVHEINTFGVVANPGNTQETAHFICAVYQAYQWTGNKEWLYKHYPAIKQGLTWLFGEMDTDNDLFPEGYGIMEVKGLNGELIDTAVYSAVALEYAKEMAKLFGEEELGLKYAERSKKLKDKILTEMWLEEEGLFADIRISGKLLHENLDDFIWQEEQSEDKRNAHLIPYYLALKEKLVADGLAECTLDRPWCFQNWVINTPIEMGLATKEQALASLERLNSPEFTGEWGLYLSGLEKTRIMTISTGVQTNANLRYGKVEEAYEQIKRGMKTFGMYLPGSHSEMSPDYGCFVQAWTSYLMLSPIITGFIGVQPKADKKEVTIKPQLPSAWDYAKIERLKVGSNEIAVDVRRDKINHKDYKVKVHSRESGWRFHGVTEVNEG